MNTPQIPQRSTPVRAGDKKRGAEKVDRIPVKVIPTTELPRKPDWIRVKVSNPGEVQRIRSILRAQKLHTVCEEAACPNLPECFGQGTATFMIMGDICTRRCPFCDVAHGRPLPLDTEEPQRLAETVAALKLRYVVVTSVDRDDLLDGGAGHFAACTEALRASVPDILVEVLVPDFRGRQAKALEALEQGLPDVFNHNIETVSRLYTAVRPGSDYQLSLQLLRDFKQRHPEIPTKCGLMVGLGETEEEVCELLRDLRAHQVDLVTIGQYLQPSRNHLAVARFVHPDEFERYAQLGKTLGFSHIASGAMVRSSYHADQQFKLAKTVSITSLNATGGHDDRGNSSY